MPFAEQINQQHACVLAARARGFAGLTKEPGYPLAVLSRVLTFVCFVVPNDTSCRGTRSAVTSHVTRNATDYCTFNASLSICRSACSRGDSQDKQYNENFHYGSPELAVLSREMQLFGSFA
jgi:hypothetical protein